MVGGTVVAFNALGGPSGNPFVQSQPNEMVQLSNGAMINPGLVASFYTHGYPQSMVDQMVANEVANVSQGRRRRNSMIAPIANTTGSQTGGTSQTSSTSAAGTVAATQNMFLQLLVAQLQNQDPTQPMDSTTFVTQLAQMQQLEQSTTTGQDVTAMHTDLDAIVADLAASTSQS